MRLVLLIVTASILLYGLLQFKFVKKDFTSNNYHPIIKSVKISGAKSKAYSVLINKCNICHAKRNRQRMFTLKNMDAMSNDIYKQVFVKKRMPKGKDNRLTSEEYASLLKWISTIKNI